MKLSKLAEKMSKEGKLPLLNFSKKEGWDGGLLFQHFIPVREGKYLLFRLRNPSEYGSPYEALEYQWSYDAIEDPNASFVPEVLGVEEDPYLTENGFFHFLTISEEPLDSMILGERTPCLGSIGNILVPDGDPEWVDEHEFFRFAHWKT